MASKPGALTASGRSEGHARVLSEGTAHRFSGSRSERLISILLRVKNGAREIPDLLKKAVPRRCNAAVVIVALEAGLPVAHPFLQV